MAARRILLSKAIASGGGVVCPPSGEQITNGGAETGDLTGWDITGSVVVVNTNPHSGTYSFYFADYPATMEQNIESLKGYTIPVVCILFCTIWLYGKFCPRANIDVIITYSDASTETIHFTNIRDVWTELDLLPSLDVSKSVAKIKIIEPVSPMIWMDDVSLVC